MINADFVELKHQCSRERGPIGVFDSGYGGLTILRQIRRLMPQYDYLYLGDNARTPYGTRSFDVVYHYNEGLPNNRQMGLERIKLHDQELLLTLRPTWQRFEKGYRLNRLKLYEVFLEQRQFDVFQAYYKDLRRQDLSGLPWADRLVIALPPRLACWPVRWYKWWLRRKSR